ncbi:MAG: dTDP-4-dehydrorhamnose 3,5-epimerase [Parachlamydiales bacterium]|nr:dTDP-4-dehydrorhamnose 3,5-epimerase [Parachlamydiales bacterium]
MKIKSLNLNGAAVIDSYIFNDSRGLFTRFFCQNELNELHNYSSIDQVNFSKTFLKGTIRGMHFQMPPFSEIKIIRCIKGSIFDVIIDIRKNSPTFLKWHSEVLSENNYKMIYIPKGFAHGFQTLEDNCELLYLHNGFYNPESENGIKYDDKLIDIKWPLKITEISKRDESFSYIDHKFEGFLI